MLFWKQSPFYPYERTILDAVVAAAAPPLAELLGAQLDQVKHVQRIRSSPEVNFYPNRKGGEWNPAALLPNLGEVRVAHVAARIGGRDHKGTVDAVAGHLFGLTLRPTVTGGRSATVEEVHVRVIDPSELVEQRAALDVAPVSFVRDSREEETAGSGRWTPLAEAVVYLVALHEADWAVLAEGPRSRLLIGRRSETGELFGIVDVESDEIAPLTASSFQEALGEAERRAV